MCFCPQKSTADITPEKWRQTIAVNLTAPFFLARALVDKMAKGGAIINIGSLQSLRAGLGDAGYGASKGGIAQLTRVMARTWGGRGITVNALIPGFFPSEMTSMVFADDELANNLAQSTALGRNGELADIGGAAVFFGITGGGIHYRYFVAGRWRFFGKVVLVAGVLEE